MRGLFGRGGPILFVVAVVYFLPLAGVHCYPFDEAIRLVGAERVLAGERPYFDFYALYGPGQFYGTAGLLWAFGHQMMAFRLALVFVNAGGAVALYQFCRSAGVGGAGALLAYFLFLLPRHGDSAELLSCDPALALVWAAGAFLVAGNQGVGAGMLLGLATLFRLDFAAYGCFAAAISCLASEWNGRRVLHRAFRVALGVVTVALAGYAPLAVHGVGPLYDCLVRLPAAHLPYRRLPFPPAEAAALPLVLGLLVAGVMLLTLAVPSVRARYLASPPARTALAFALGLLPGLLAYGLGRCDAHHLFAPYTAGLAAAAVLCRTYFDHPSRGVIATGAAAGGTAVAVVFGAAVGTYVSLAPLGLDRAAGVRDWLAVAETYRTAVTDLGPPDDQPVFVGCARHDRIFVSRMILYFLAGRRPGIYHAHMDPGVTTTEAVQRRIIEDLERNRVVTVLLWKEPLPDEPNLSRVPGSRRLDHWLAERFARVKDTPSYTLLHRRLGLR